jgi:hypothetical protein
MSTKCDQCGVVNPADIHTCGAGVQAGAVQNECLCKDKCLHAGSFGQCKGLPSVLAAPVQETIAQTFTGLPLRKLRELLAGGWAVNGVSFERTEEDGAARRGAITTGGMVLWWNQAPAAQPAPVRGFIKKIEDLIQERDDARSSLDFYKRQGGVLQETCTWTKSNDPHMPDTFDAACGVLWTFSDGGPVENGMHFCPGCGAAVSVAAPEPEEDLYDLAIKADNGGQP